MLFQPQFWEDRCLILPGVLPWTPAGLFYILAVALISPFSANRALMPRLYLTLLWLARRWLLAGFGGH